MKMRTWGKQIPIEGRNVVDAADVRSRNFRSLTATSAKVGHLGGSDRPRNELNSTIKSDFPDLVLKALANITSVPKNHRKMSSELTKPLGEWVEQLFNDAFFYDNDDIAFKAMEERLSPDIKVRYQFLQYFSLIRKISL